MTKTVTSEMTMEVTLLRARFEDWVLTPKKKHNEESDETAKPVWHWLNTQFIRFCLKQFEFVISCQKRFEITTANFFLIWHRRTSNKQTHKQTSRKVLATR